MDNNVNLGEQTKEVPVIVDTSQHTVVVTLDPGTSLMSAADNVSITTANNNEVTK